MGKLCSMSKFEKSGILAHPKGQIQEQPLDHGQIQDQPLDQGQIQDQPLDQGQIHD